MNSQCVNPQVLYLEQNGSHLVGVFVGLSVLVHANVFLSMS